jgi:hypothetical protein
MYKIIQNQYTLLSFLFSNVLFIVFSEVVVSFERSDSDFRPWWRRICFSVMSGVLIVKETEPFVSQGNIL